MVTKVPQHSSVHIGLPDERLGSAARVPEFIGSLQHFPELRSRFLERPHDVTVCLPPGYERDTERHYPVLYLHDGQNVFDDWPKSFSGVQWGVDTTMRALVHARLIEPVILVAIGNAGRDRIDEYTPTRDASHDGGGQADLYGQMLVYEIKPFIDHQYRTSRDAGNTAVCGSSLGGLLSLHLALSHSAVFGKVALMSPSVWWDDRWVVRQLGASDAQRPRLRVWLDVGTEETRMLKGVRLLARMLERKGWVRGVDFGYYEAQGAMHDEHAWGERTGRVLRFLFPFVEAVE